MVVGKWIVELLVGAVVIGILAFVWPYKWELTLAAFFLILGKVFYG